MKFKTWLESSPEYDSKEWTQEEIEQEALAANAQIEPPFDPPDYCDPDDLFQSNGGGLFTFLYSPAGLQIASWATTHNEMLRVYGNAKDQHGDAKDRHAFLCGRYGIKDETPIVATWWSANTEAFLMPCLQELMKRNLVHPDAYVFDNNRDNKGTVAQLLNIVRTPKAAPIRNTADTIIQIGAKSYYLYQIGTSINSPLYIH